MICNSNDFQQEIFSYDVEVTRHQRFIYIFSPSSGFFCHQRQATDKNISRKNFNLNFVIRFLDKWQNNCSAIWDEWHCFKWKMREKKYESLHKSFEEIFYFNSMGLKNVKHLKGFAVKHCLNGGCDLAKQFVNKILYSL